MLIKEVKNNLTNTIIPFWKRMRDDVYGGYYGYMDFNLKTDKMGIKGCILNSRILWFFSNAYRELKEESLLKEAEHAYHFLMNHCIDEENGGVYWSVNYDGNVSDNTKHTYNQAFALYALSSYYEISRDGEALRAAWSLYDIIEKKCSDDTGYLEAFDIHFNPITNEKLSENGVIAEKTMNTLLHVLEAYTEFYRIIKEPELQEKLTVILNLIRTKIYNRDKKRQDVFFDKQWNSLLDLHSYGHDIEAAWLMDRACEVLRNNDLKKQTEKITKALTQNIYERAYINKSVLNECENGIDDTSRIWWIQAEAIVGFVNGYQKDMDKTEYLTAAWNIWEFIKEYLLDPRENSEWYWEVDEYGCPSAAKPIVEPWKCPYHNGRMCLEIIRRNVDAS